MIEVKNALITGATISNGDHGLLSAWVQLDYGGTSQGFGGFSLYLPKTFKHAANSPNYAGHFIWRVLEVADVDEWGRLKGKTVRAKCDYGKVHAIGHILRENWFDPSVEFEAMRIDGITPAQHPLNP